MEWGEIHLTFNQIHEDDFTVEMTYKKNVWLVSTGENLTRPAAVEWINNSRAFCFHSMEYVDHDIPTMHANWVTVYLKSSMMGFIKSKHPGSALMSCISIIRTQDHLEWYTERYESIQLTLYWFDKNKKKDAIYRYIFCMQHTLP